jgi:SNF2 family DNA or RNA helicase
LSDWKGKFVAVTTEVADIDKLEMTGAALDVKEDLVIKTDAVVKSESQSCKCAPALKAERVDEAIKAEPSEAVEVELTYSASVFAAQREAEELIDLEDAATKDEIVVLEDQSAPRLLQLPPSMEKTQSQKAKGQQLDLLLLKAESYSQFILENQKRSKVLEAERIAHKANASPSKRKLTKSPAAKPNKKGTGKKGADARSTEAELDAYDTVTATSTSEGFCQPTDLTGGTLMPYQLEGLQWLLSLWENGLSGILAGE